MPTSSRPPALPDTRVLIRRRLALIPILVLSFASPVSATEAEQHDHPPATQAQAQTQPQPPPPPRTNPDPMAMMDAMEPMNHWMTMLHGYAFLTFNRQGGSSGEQEFESENHLMVMAMRRWWRGKLSLLGTFTLEPATVPPEGYPLLFQRGETYDGVLLVDLQHPHDIFVQLAARWDRRLSQRVTMGIYLAPVGEPAVGPIAFPHRVSASAYPLSPLAHHNQDSTHLSADVITLSLGVPKVTLEGSVFHGAEPDDKRWNIDQGTPDSYAGRVTWRPGGGFAFQVSAARRQDPEELEEGDQTRQTASAEYIRSRPDGFLAVTFILGRNLLREGTEWGNGLEATWKFAGSNHLFGRVESVDRDLFELINKRQRPTGLEPDWTTVQAATIGYMRNVRLGIFREGVDSGLGAAVTFYRYDDVLEDTYGNMPVSAQVYLKVGFSAGGGMSHAAPPHH